MVLPSSDCHNFFLDDFEEDSSIVDALDLSNHWYTSPGLHNHSLVGENIVLRPELLMMIC